MQDVAQVRAQVLSIAKRQPDTQPLQGVLSAESETPHTVETAEERARLAELAREREERAREREEADRERERKIAQWEEAQALEQARLEEQKQALEAMARAQEAPDLKHSTMPRQTLLQSPPPLVEKKQHGPVAAQENEQDQALRQQQLERVYTFENDHR